MEGSLNQVNSRAPSRDNEKNDYQISQINHGKQLHSLQEPQYWWECLVLQCDVVWINMAAMFFVITTAAFMNLNNVFTYKNWLITWIAGAAIYSVSWVVTTFLWTNVAGLRYPIPLGGIINAVFGLSAQVSLSTLFLSFSPSLRLSSQCFNCLLPGERSPHLRKEYGSRCYYTDI